MKLLDRLDRLGRKGILKLVHFHLGSQITDIRFVKAGLDEVVFMMTGDPANWALNYDVIRDVTR